MYIRMDNALEELTGCTVYHVLCIIVYRTFLLYNPWHFHDGFSGNERVVLFFNAIYSVCDKSDTRKDITTQ